MFSTTIVAMASEANNTKGPLQVHSLGFFSVLDDHRPARPLLGCQLPTLDTNYRSRVSFKSFTYIAALLLSTYRVSAAFG